MKKCKNCGIMMLDEANFCPECGCENKTIKNPISSNNKNTFNNKNISDNKKKRSKKPLIIILCLICVAAGAFLIVNKLMTSSDDQNGIKNKQAVLYDNYIYYFEGETLYQKKVNNEDDSDTAIMKFSGETKGNSTYKNLVVYKDRLYAIQQEQTDETTNFYIVSMKLNGTDYRKEATPPKFKGEDGSSYMGYSESFSIANNTIYYTYGDYPVSYYGIYKHEIGTSKSIDTKYSKYETPVLYEQYAYYIKDDDGKTTKPTVIKRDIETGKETTEITVQERNTTASSLGVGKDKFVFSTDSAIIWKKPNDENNYNIEDVVGNADSFYIVNMNNKEIIYCADDVYYKWDIEEKVSEKLFSEEDLGNDFGARVTGIDQVGDQLMIYGSFDENDDGFLFFIKEKEDTDYESKVRAILSGY